MEVSPQVNVEKGSNLIINYLPNDLTDEDFHDMFQKIGPLYSAKIMRNKVTGYSYGYGFVNYLKADDAKTAIGDLNGLQLQNKRIKVAPCRRGEGADDIKNANLYVANLPKSTSEDELKRLFEAYGDVIRSKILMNQADNTSKGCGFILFAKTTQADDAIKGLNGQHVDGGTSPLVVKRAKEDQKQQQQQQMGIMGRAQPAVHIIHHYQPLPGQDNGGAIASLGAPASGPMRNAVSKTQRFNPMAQPAGPYGGAGAYGGAPAMAMGNDPNMGHTLFVYNIGAEATEIDLYTLFGPFGAIIKVHIQRDLSTGAGKGFGFVTFGDYNDASLAVQAMNGYPYEKNALKPLQVSFKTNKSK